MREIAKRKVDELGRIVLPLEVRTALRISQQDELRIFIDGKNIVLRKEKVKSYNPLSMFKKT